jgi:hypothetical protein
MNLNTGSFQVGDPLVLLGAGLARHRLELDEQQTLLAGVDQTRVRETAGAPA